MNGSLLLQKSLVMILLVFFPTLVDVFAVATPFEFGMNWAIDKAGNVFLTGSSRDPNNLSDYVTTKYNKEGKKLWERWYNKPPGHDFGMCSGIIIGPCGNAYVTGKTFVRERISEYDDTVFGYVTVKYDLDGKQLWEAIYDEPNRVLNDPVGIAVDENGNAYISGESYDIDSWLLCTDYGENANPHFITIKYDMKGKQLWAVRYKGQRNHVNSLSDIAVDKAGKVYLTGSSVININSDGGIDSQFITINYDTNGRELWVARYIGEPNSINNSCILALNGKNRIYVAGKSHIGGNSGYSDLIIIAYDKNGKQQWLGRCREPAKTFVFPTAIAVDREGNVIVTGEISSSFSGSGYSTTDLETTMANREIVTLKYNVRGREQWRVRYKAPKGYMAFSCDLMTDAEGKTFVIGTMMKSIFEVDRLIIKYDSNGNEQYVRRLKSESELVKLLSSISH
jgi:hypothetical protein